MQLVLSTKAQQAFELGGYVTSEVYDKFFTSHISLSTRCKMSLNTPCRTRLNFVKSWQNARCLDFFQSGKDLTAPSLYRWNSGSTKSEGWGLTGLSRTPKWNWGGIKWSLEKDTWSLFQLLVQRKKLEIQKRRKRRKEQKQTCSHHRPSNISQVLKASTTGAGSQHPPLTSVVLYPSQPHMWLHFLIWLPWL